MRLIIDGEYNKDLVKLIGKQNLPISHMIVHVHALISKIKKQIK